MHLTEVLATDGQTLAPRHTDGERCNSMRKSDLILQLRAEVREVKDCFMRFSFQGSALAIAVAGFILGPWATEHRSVGLAARHHNPNAYLSGRYFQIYDGESQPWL